MNINLRMSLDRAIKLLGTPANYDDYISIKIKPLHGGCCCFHCWPRTWTEVNEYISPCGPLKDEGDVLIKNNNETFVLECHESGPEIILYGVASGVIAGLIVELITIILRNLHKESKHPASLKIIKRRKIKGHIEEEDIIEIDLPLSDAITKKLNDNIRNALKNRGE